MDNVFKVFSEIKDYLVTVFNTYNSEIISSDDGYTLFTPDFIFVYLASKDETPEKFVLTFYIGTHACIAAEVTRIIGTCMDIYDVNIVEDCFLDKEDNVLYYGDEAVRHKYEELLKSQNQFKCPFCNLVYSNKYLDRKHGVCIKCSTEYQNMVWM